MKLSRLAFLLPAFVPAVASSQVQVEVPAEVPAWRACYDTIRWFDRIEVVNTEAQMMELVMQQRLEAHAVEWITAALEVAPSFEECLAEAKERGRPLLWYVPTVAGQHMILPHLLDRYMQVGPFSDPELSELINRRFVAIQRPVAGELGARFGLSMPAFMEPGLLVFSPAGEELLRIDRIFTFQADWFAAKLRAVLEGLGDDAHRHARFEEAHAAWVAAPKDGALALACATEALRDGAFPSARSALTGLVGFEASLLRARLARLERRPAEAAQALEAAWSLASDAEQEALVQVERARLALRRGADRAAEADLEAALAKDVPHARRAEAAYFLGAVRWFDRREDEALAAWRRALELEPRSPWAAKSAAYLAIGGDGQRGEGPLTRAMEDLRWLDEAAYASPDTHYVRTPKEARAILQDGFRFLVRQQRSDGSWRGSRWGGDGVSVLTEEVLGGALGNIHTAISAVACSAVRAWRELDPELADAVVMRGEAFLLADELVDREGVIWSYADILRLLHFARAYPDADARPQAIQAAMEEWVAYLVDQQAEAGGPFSHYTYTSTFVTAMGALALHGAREVGLAVDEEVFAKAADVLEGARGGDQGLFGYLVDAPQVNRTMAGAACRQPLCEWVLALEGRVERKAVEHGIELFLDSYPAAIEPGRKSNFHIPSLDGTAGYFFFHNFLATCLATVDDPDRPLAKERARLFELLCELPEVDGGFVDSGFSYGKAYATAMALLSFDALEVQGG